MNLVAPNHTETMYYTSVYKFVEPGITLPQFSIWLPAAILDFSKCVFLCHAFFSFYLRFIIYWYNMLFYGEHIELHHYYDNSPFFLESNMAAL